MSIRRLLTSQYLLTLCFLEDASCFIGASFFSFSFLRGHVPSSPSFAVASRSLVFLFLFFSFHRSIV